LAFGGLAAGTFLFMTLRALGVGPFATLVSAGVLKERDPLVVAEFANRTSDSTLAASITEAFRIDLAQSRMVRLIGSDLVAGTLERMRLDPATRLTEQVARDLSQRIGASGVVVGEIAPLAGGYVLSVRLVNAADGTTLLAGRETADSPTGIIAAIEKLSRKLREGIGESLRTIRGGPPLAEVTTSSLAALKAYTEGARAADYGHDAEAVRLLKQSVTLDSNFAMAWRKLGVAYGHLGTEREAEVAAVTRAYQLRGRLSPREADHAEAYYYFDGLADADHTIQSYERLLASWPDDDIALSNLAEAYGSKGRFADMERLERRAMALGAVDPITLTDLVGSQLAQGKTAALDSTLALFARTNPTTPARWRTFSNLARARGEIDRAVAMADSLARLDDPHWRAIGNDLAARALRRVGRLRESERRAVQAISAAQLAGEALTALGFELDLARVDLMFRDQPEAALRRTEAAVARHPLDSLLPGNRPYGRLIALYAMAGRLDRADALEREYQRLVPASLRESDGWAAYGEGWLAIGHGDGKAAVAQFRRARARWMTTTSTLLEEARSFEQMGQPDSALASYERLLTLGVPHWEEGPKDFTLPLAYRRLGELYEAGTNREKALEYYGKFVALWKNADPDLQPKVQEVRRRMTALVAEPR